MPSTGAAAIQSVLSSSLYCTALIAARFPFASPVTVMTPSRPAFDESRVTTGGVLSTTIAPQIASAFWESIAPSARCVVDHHFDLVAAIGHFRRIPLERTRSMPVTASVPDGVAVSGKIVAVAISTVWVGTLSGKVRSSRLSRRYAAGFRFSFGAGCAGTGGVAGGVIVDGCLRWDWRCGLCAMLAGLGGTGGAVGGLLPMRAASTGGVAGAGGAGGAVSISTGIQLAPSFE